MIRPMAMRSRNGLRRIPSKPLFSRRPATGWPATWRPGGSRTRSSGSGRSCGSSSWPTRRSSTASRWRPRRWRCGCVRAAAGCPTPSRSGCRRGVRRAAPARGTGGAGQLAAYLATVRGPAAGATGGGATGHHGRHAGPRALNLGLRRALEDDDRVVLIGEDIGKLGGVFRVTDAPAEGLRRRPGHRLPARRERDRRRCRRPGDAGLPAGRRDPVRRLRLPGVRPDRVAGGQAARALASADLTMPIGHPASRTAAASVRSSTTARARRRTSRTRPACAS